jgi:hypothetical protein
MVSNEIVLATDTRQKFQSRSNLKYAFRYFCSVHSLQPSFLFTIWNWNWATDSVRSTLVGVSHNSTLMTNLIADPVSYRITLNSSFANFLQGIITFWMREQPQQNINEWSNVSSWLDLSDTEIKCVMSAWENAVFLTPFNIPLKGWLT